MQYHARTPWRQRWRRNTRARGDNLRRGARGLEPGVAETRIRFEISARQITSRWPHMPAQTIP